MSSKEIFAALEIADHEIRLVVAELHNLKLNVMKVERVETDGVSHLTIENETAVVNGIKKAVTNASKLIGAPVKRVLLVLPSKQMQKVAKRITVRTENGVIKQTDVEKAMLAARQLPLAEDTELVNLVLARYIANGYTSRRFPLEEKAESLGVEAELLAADKEMVYAYVKTVEKAGLAVIDICLDSYALGCEAALFEQAISQYVLLLRLERNTTTLSLLANGKLESSVVLDNGYGELIGAISHQFGLPLDISARLLLYNFRIGKKDLPTSPIYFWTTDKISHTLSEAELAEVALPLLTSWVQQLKEVSEEILAAGKVSGVLMGEGAEMQGLAAFFSEQFGIECTAYIPETLGARSSALSACTGAFYAYNDQKALRKETLYSIDESQFIQAVSLRKEKSEPTEDTLSNRFKKIFTRN